MTLLVVAPPGTTASSINPRRATPILPIAIGRPNSPPPRSLPKQALIAHRQQTASDEIPIASDARPLHTSRGFLPWRFADAGPPVSAAPPSWGRHPQTFTIAPFLQSTGYFRTSPVSRPFQGGSAFPDLPLQHKITRWEPSSFLIRNRTSTRFRRWFDSVLGKECWFDSGQGHQKLFA